MALLVKNVCFSYDKMVNSKLILNNVCIEVPKGNIYALLGPSGCGKTTLFKLVIGLSKPNSGCIQIFGYSPGTPESGIPGRGIGYMPQEVSVQTDLTIFEILQYFGRLLAMGREELNDRIDYLVKLFDLPEKSRLIGNTSGGQQRRISLAIAMLHKPRLLILDEPTVGVDPILCERIWKLLLKLCNDEQTTIVITTHYIEETRRANVVGFMRRGTMLEENTPEGVMEKYGTRSLEEAFFKIAKAQNVTRKRSHNPCQLCTEKNKPLITTSLKEPLPENQLSSKVLFVRKTAAIFNKVVIETHRNPISMIYLFVLSFITAGLLTVWFGQTPKGLTVAWVVDEIPFNFTPVNVLETTTFERTNNSEENGDLDHGEDNKNWIPYMPQILKKALTGDIIKLKKYDTVSMAEKDLRTKKVYGVIHLQRNFSFCHAECDPFLNFGQEFVDNQTVQCGTIYLITDTTNKLISTAIEFFVSDSLQKFRKNVAIAVGLSPSIMKTPIEFVPIYGKLLNKDDIFGVEDFVAPGFIYYVSHIFGYFPSILAVAKEQGDDMFVRNYVSGVTALQYITGQLIARFIFLAVSNLLNVFASISIIGLQCHGSIFLVIALSWLTSMLGILHGALIALLVPQPIFCLFCFAAACFNILWFGGIIWNVQSQEYYIRWLQYFLPYAIPLQTMRTIMARKDAPWHPFIWPGFALLLIWIGFSFALCVFLTKIKK